MKVSYCRHCCKMQEHEELSCFGKVLYMCLGCSYIIYEPMVEGGREMGAEKDSEKVLYIKCEAVAASHGTLSISIETGYPPVCEHKNGLYNRVTFGLFFRRVYVCVDCGQVLYGKELKAWERGRA